MTKYFGQFTDRESVAREFFDGEWNDAFEVPPDFPSEDEILFASYETPDYEGYALVLVEREGQLFEVHGSHCSCYGLEGQWKPEATSWEALAMRPRPQAHEYDPHYDGAKADAKEALWALVDARSEAALAEGEDTRG